MALFFQWVGYAFQLGELNLQFLLCYFIITPNLTRVGSGDSIWHRFSIISIMWLLDPKYGKGLVEPRRK
jgi:hypothetical protein